MARARTVRGPYEKKSSPVVRANSVWAGPGHCSVLPVAADPSRWLMFYHSWKVARSLCTNHLPRHRHGPELSGGRYSSTRTACCGRDTVQVPDIGSPHPRLFLQDEVTWDSTTGWPRVATDSPSVGPMPVP